MTQCTLYCKATQALEQQSERPEEPKQLGAAHGAPDPTPVPFTLARLLHATLGSGRARSSRVLDAARLGLRRSAERMVPQTHVESCRSMVPVLECRSHRRLVALVHGFARYPRAVSTMKLTTCDWERSDVSIS